MIHASVMVTHFREYWLFGLFFAIVTPLQLLWAYLVSRPGVSRELLVIGALANLSIAVVWLVSRTAGLPFGPDPWQAETVHIPDVVATLDEVTIAVLVLLIVRPSLDGVRRWAMGATWVLAGLSLVGAMLGPGTH